MQQKLQWQKKSRRQILETKVMTVTEIDSVSPRGDTGTYIVMDAPDWVIVIPILKNPDRFLMVKQWRHGTQSLSTEFPGGVMDAGETPEQAALRELKEETGCTGGKLIYLGSMSPNPALMSNRVHCFAAEDISEPGNQHLDPDEFVEYFPLPCDEVYQKMGSQEYPHALMTAALELYRQYVTTKKV